MQLREATHKVLRRLAVMLAICLYSLGCITRRQLYQFVDSVEPRLLKKLLEQDERG